MVEVTILLIRLITLTTVQIIVLNESNAMTMKRRSERREVEVEGLKIFGDETNKEPLEETTIVPQTNQAYLKKSANTSQTFKERPIIGNKQMTRTKKDTLKAIPEVDFNPKARTDGYRLSKPEDSPYAVFLYFTYTSGKVSWCSGSLLTLEWVLTSAHCMITGDSSDLVNETRIIAGAASPLDEELPKTAQTVLSEKLIIHPSYVHDSGDTKDVFDIMLVKTVEKFNLTKYVGTIKLSLNPWSYQGYKDCVLAAFGTVYVDPDTTHKHDSNLKTHKLKVKKPCVCSWAFADEERNRLMCAEPKEDYGFCSGDSGSGLVCDGKIWSITTLSWSLNPFRFCQEGPKVECGSKKTLHAFLDSCPFLEWISDHVKIFSKSQISKKCLNFTDFQDNSHDNLESSKGSLNLQSFSLFYFLLTLSYFIRLC